jgi:hypothetical protein
MSKELKVLKSCSKDEAIEADKSKLWTFLKHDREAEESCFYEKGIFTSYHKNHLFCLFSEHLKMKRHETTHGL